MFLVSFCLVHLFVQDRPIVDANGDELSAEKSTFVNELIGDWKIRRIYQDGDIFKGPPLNASGARISCDGMLFLGQRGEHKNVPCRFTDVHPGKGQIDIEISIAETTYRKTLRKDGDLLWIVTGKDPSKLPTTLVPTEGTFCILLMRNHKENVDHVEPGDQPKSR